jgi:hypothetical protein
MGQVWFTPGFALSSLGVSAPPGYSLCGIIELSKLDHSTLAEAKEVRLGRLHHSSRLAVLPGALPQHGNAISLGNKVVSGVAYHLPGLDQL